MRSSDVIRAVRRRLGRSQTVRAIYGQLDLWWKYGELRPERVPLSTTGNAIFVNPAEPRGRAILACFGKGQPQLKQLWVRMIEVMKPTVVLDVGANYGEFVFMVRHPPGTRAIAVEADPALVEYLHRSRAAHSDCERIQIVSALATDAPGPDKEFYVDRAWSGRSSALKQPSHRDPVTRRLRTTSIDAELADGVSSADRLVFKIDVEGYEPPVLEGMRETLRRVSSSIGLVEMNPAFLRAIGTVPTSYVESLMSRFHCALVKSDGEVLTGERMLHASDQGAGGDLLLASDSGLLDGCLGRPITP